MSTERAFVDALAQEIRRVDGNHDLGAGALAEALMPFLDREKGRELAGFQHRIRHRSMTDWSQWWQGKSFGAAPDSVWEVEERELYARAPYPLLPPSE